MDFNLLIEVLDEAGFEFKNRVRGGKVQRRKKVAKKGFKIQGGKAIRQSAEERRKRKISQKRGARKRKAKMAQTLRKRSISIRKRKQVG